ncbi:esterase/lipase family protein [Nonomuraea basaltis]|uniref:esterase/lipase family protein n=1 Tax=Nonomuraea basaltis TaxID=2495887 RepID=UPI00110C5897|nr:alpha/beta hydrolase [Nonomuraea basaltis]TMR95759.1 alpha/beta hydrolase [Nonomuraea basaltis]
MRARVLKSRRVVEKLVDDWIPRPAVRRERLFQGWLDLCDDPDYLLPPFDGDGLPVLLVGGLASVPVLFEPMRRWLERAGCRPALAPVRYGFDCGERTMAGVTRSLQRMADEHGRPVAVVAHSRGGQFARVAAVRHPELVAGVVALASPLTDMVAASRVLVTQLTILGLAGTLGVPRLMSFACLVGECCQDFRSDLSAPFPGLPYTSVYTETDLVVRWRSCLDPYARHEKVETTHSGMLVHPDVFRILVKDLSGMTPTRPSIAVPPAAPEVVPLRGGRRQAAAAAA